ncbi:unnamed protein product [Orchesella dallaii]|uniref:non-specific serine/threonine protein kinase n=1 Tax=Orchesella dallaii TaxID=48710 RepID=A0ABP1PQ41_9HEXA
MFPRKREQVVVGDGSKETVLERLSDLGVSNDKSQSSTECCQFRWAKCPHNHLSEMVVGTFHESVNHLFQTAEIDEDERKSPIAVPFPIPKPCGQSPRCPEAPRPWTTSSASSSGACVNSPGKYQGKRIVHPFMKQSSPQNGKNKILVNCLCPPESPMDSSYQAIARFCSRKKKEINDDGCFRKASLNHSSCSSSPFECVLWACSQDIPIPIGNIFSGVKDVVKIGEGVYGEVYSGSFKYFKQSAWVYKIVAIEGNTLVNGEKQKTFSEILPEILVSQELSKLRHGLNNCYTDGYVFMRNARVAKGKYPEDLVKSWVTFHEEYESDNDKPEFQSDQLYMVLEFEFAGQDIESFNFEDARQTFSIVLQVAHILAVGECALEFEHRDLHWGNILVEEWQPFHINYLVNGQTLLVPAVDVKAVVIDFTISRVKASDQAIFLDLKDDEEQFLGTGDHQFDIYRMMRDHNRNQWDTFSPKSNIFWLHYLAEKLFMKGEYSTPKSPYHVKALRKLREFSTIVFEYDSAMTFVFSAVCDSYKEFLTSSALRPPKRRARTAT